MTQFDKEMEHLPGECADCSTCSHHQAGEHNLENMKLGVCTNSESDHFGHVVVTYHPGCEEHSG